MAYNPINRLLRLTGSKSRLKRRPVHNVVRWLEFAAMLSFLPGMFIFLYAFVPSFAALWAAFEIEKGSYGLASGLFIFFNLALGAIGLLAGAGVREVSAEGLAVFVLYGGLGWFGLLFNRSGGIERVIFQPYKCMQCAPYDRRTSNPLRGLAARCCKR